MHHIIYVRTLYHQYFCIFPRERPFFLVWIRIICTFVHFQIKWSTCDKSTVTEMKTPWSMQEIQGNFKTPLAPKKSETDLDYFYGLVKRQILRWGRFSRHVDIFTWWAISRFQSPTSHLFPDKSSNTTEANLRDSIYCNAAVWSLYQVRWHLVYYSDVNTF